MHQTSPISPAEANASGSGEPEMKIMQTMEAHNFIFRNIISINAIITFDIEHNKFTSSFSNYQWMAKYIDRYIFENHNDYELDEYFNHTIEFQSKIFHNDMLCNYTTRYINEYAFNFQIGNVIMNFNNGFTSSNNLNVYLIY